VIGSTIDGKYLVKDVIGQGGMGSVYEAEHTATGRRVAVKVINSGDLTKDQQILSRFEREARAAGAIDTQYITQVLDAGLDRDSNLPFMAMEYLEGEDLQRLLKRVGPISPDLALRVTAQACLGLRKAHESKVVHRDIKPHNLFLAHRDAGEIIIKLLDFGIAKVKMDQAQSREGADLTKTGNLLGSPLYVSPEQARGKRQIDHRTDIYSMGAVMYQMLCGRTPFEHATALGELILMVCTEPPAAVQDHAPWVPPSVAEICHKCIQKNPDERFQTADELFEAVRALLPGGWNINETMLVSLADSQRQQEQPRAEIADPATYDSGRYEAQTGVVPSVPPPADVASTTGPVMGPATERPRSGGGSKVPLVVAAAVAVIGAVAGVFALTRNDGPAAEPTPTVSPAPAPPPPPQATDTAAPPPAPKDVAPKRVKVVIIPEDAIVEVEGTETELAGGLLELTGKPGKVFKVKAKKGTGETEVEVVITEAGALPPKVEVLAGKKHVIKRQPMPGAAAPPPPADAQPPPPPPGKVPGQIKVDDSEFK